METDGSSIFFHALGYFAFIILSGIAFLTCFIFFVIRISQGHRHRWGWLGAAVLSLLVLIFSIYVFVSKVAHTVKNLNHRVAKNVTATIEEIQAQDSSYKYNDYYTNPTIKKLREFETLNSETNVPKEFYVYYGFNDYYRMPITYEYSLHSNDLLETATLFNEGKVTEFNVNDNGEFETGMPDITEFAFDNSAFIGKSKGFKFWVLSLNIPNQKMTVDIKSAKEAFKIAHKEYGYRGYDTLITVLEYNKLFR